MPATICLKCQRRGTVVAYLAKLPLRCTACGQGLTVMTDEDAAAYEPTQPFLSLPEPKEEPEPVFAHSDADLQLAAPIAEQNGTPTITVGLEPELPPLFPIVPPPEPIIAERRLKPIDDSMSRSQLSDLLKEIVSLPSPATMSAVATIPEIHLPASPPTSMPTLAKATELEAAPKGRRLMARFIMAACVVALVFFAPKFGTTIAGLGILPATLPAPVQKAVGFVPLALFVLLNLLLLALRGQDIGKLLVGIKIVNENGTKPGLRNAFFRREFIIAVFVGAILFPGQLLSMQLQNTMIFLPFIVIAAVVALVDVMFIFLANDRCLHDRLAQTCVVEA